MQRLSKGEIKICTNQPTKLDKIHEYNIRNRQPITVIVFKLFSKKTPVEIFKLITGIYFVITYLGTCTG